MIDRIRDIVPHVASVQLSDWREPAVSEYDQHLPGEGEIPLEEIVGAFISTCEVEGDAHDGAKVEDYGGPVAGREGDFCWL